MFKNGLFDKTISILISRFNLLKKTFKCCQLDTIS